MTRDEMLKLDAALKEAAERIWATHPNNPASVKALEAARDAEIELNGYTCYGCGSHEAPDEGALCAKCRS